MQCPAIVVALNYDGKQYAPSKEEDEVNGCSYHFMAVDPRAVLVPTFDILPCCRQLG
jgi:hypothetical protein